MVRRLIVVLGSLCLASTAHAEVYCKAEGVPRGCVWAPKDAGANGVGVLPGAGAGAAGVGVTPGAGVGSPGVGVTPGVGVGAPGAGLNRGGPVNRVGPR